MNILFREMSTLFGKRFWWWYHTSRDFSTFIMFCTQHAAIIDLYWNRQPPSFDTIVKVYARIGATFLFFPVLAVTFLQDYTQRKTLQEKAKYPRGAELYVYESYFQTARVIAAGVRPVL